MKRLGQPLRNHIDCLDGSLERDSTFSTRPWVCILSSHAIDSPCNVYSVHIVHIMYIVQASLHSPNHGSTYICSSHAIDSLSNVHSVHIVHIMYILQASLHSPNNSMTQLKPNVVDRSSPKMFYVFSSVQK